MKLRQKLAYGVGAVGKDMVYMLSASYVLYYYQDILGVSSLAMGIILMVARVFDALNDPLMGMLVAKTKTRWGKFRPWLLIGTITNAVILFLMFAAPPSLDGGGLVAYAAITYILWGVTYTMMDIPYWSMVPAFTSNQKDRESMSTFGRSCAGVGSAIITVATMMMVPILGSLMTGKSYYLSDNPTAAEMAIKDSIEMEGFKWFALIVAVLFIVFIIITCIGIKEKSSVDMKTSSVKEMFKALFKNDQAITVVLTIVLVNTAIYITSNLVIYFFKYDFGGADWNGNYVLFTMFGGVIQILAMMLFFPILRKFMSAIRVFYTSIILAIFGYASLLIISFTCMNNVYILFIPGFCIFAANGMLSVLTTLFLANTVDYGELKNGTREESVIFSMQTFVVKLASGFAALVVSICLMLFNIAEDTTSEISAGLSMTSTIGLRLTMALIPIIGLVIAFFIFKKRYILTEEKVDEIAGQLAKKE